MLPHWTEHDIVVGGIKLHYYRTGAGEKPPLVLLHGFTDSSLCLLPVARELEAGWDIILPDARGHGKSVRVVTGERYDLPADAAGLVRALGLREAVLAGHSMGAVTSSTVEARFPGLAKALILEDPPWFDSPPPLASGQSEQEPPPNPWYDWLRSLPGRSLEEIIARGQADNPTWPAGEWLAWAEAKKQFDLNILKVESVDMPWRDVVKAIHIPTLLVTGDPDKGAVITSEQASEAAALSPAIRVAHIPGVGHNIRRESFTRYMQAVTAFLAQVKALP